MGATYTRQSSYSDGDVITAAHTNDEFNQLLAAFASSSGHTHDGTAAEGGPVTKLLGTSITIGDGTSGTDITVTFDGESNDGVLKWMEDEDYFEFSDDILVASTEKIQFRDTAIYINSSTDGQLDLVADTEIQIAATTVDINGNVDISGTLTIGSAGISEAELEVLDGLTVSTTEVNILDGDTTATSTTVADADRVVMNDNGTMVQVAVTDLAAYFDDEITAMPNLTSVGTLTTLTVDNVIVNGTNIGHTSDTDLMTLTSGVLTVAGEVDATTLDISGNADIDGTTNLDEVDIDGAVQIDGATTFGVDDTGVDVKFFGATSGAYLLWDESADKLLTAGGAVVDIVKDKLLIGGTAVTTTAAELNILDGKSFVDEDDMSSDSATAIASQQSIKAYVDANRNVTGLNATGAEINTVADASAISIDTSTAVANNDAILMYDNSGTAMKYFDVDLLDTYYAGTTKTLTNKTLTAPKFADGGFIADANGNELIMLQTASSAVNQLEVTNSASGGAVVVGASGDDSNIDIDISPKGTGEVNIAAGNLNYAGTAITSTGAELNLLDGSSAGTVENSKAVIYGSSGEVNGTTLQIGGSSINSTAAELNLLDGSAKSTSSITIIDADGLVIIDGTTTKQIPASDIKTYVYGSISGDATTNSSGALTIANDAVESGMLNDNVISGQTELASGLADTDELMVSDGGTIKRMDMSVVKSYLTSAGFTSDDPTALAIALG